MVVYEFNQNKKENIFGRFSLTTELIFLNVFLFILFILLDLFIGNNFIKNYIAIVPANVLAGKYLWTFLTSMFMHGGFFHLLMNMVSLFFVGGLIEKLIGKKRYGWFYLVSGIFAGILFVILGYFGIDTYSYAVGASGALFGLIGLLVILTPNLPVYLMFIPIPIKMKYAGPGMLVVLWLISVTANLPIGNVAHLGGLLAGLGYGVYLKLKFPHKTKFIERRFR